VLIYVYTPSTAIYSFIVYTTLSHTHIHSHIHIHSHTHITDDLEKSNRTEEYNLTNSKTDEYHTLYSWTDFGAFRSGNSDAIPLKRYTYKMQEICNDYEYEISSIDGVDTYSYKEWCYKRFTDETKEQVRVCVCACVRACVCVCICFSTCE
jgi:hypothetical protein